MDGYIRAIRRILIDVQGQPIALPPVFVCSEEGGYVMTNQEVDMVRERMVAFSQDTGHIPLPSGHNHITTRKAKGRRNKDIPGGSCKISGKRKKEKSFGGGNEEEGERESS